MTIPMNKTPPENPLIEKHREIQSSNILDGLNRHLQAI